MGTNVVRGLLRLALFCSGVCALLAGGAALAQTLDQTLFGPKQYLRTTGAPDQYTDTFTLPASVSAPFQVRIVNGDANGGHRVSAAWVTLNGVQIAGPADFGQGVALVERAVSVTLSNTLQIRVASAPGAYLTISVLGTRIPSVPTSLSPNPLTITAGASGHLTATLSPTPIVAGTLALSSSTAAAAVPASVPFASGQSAVTIPVSGIAVGSTTITASANGGSASATVNVTPAPPTVTSLAPGSLSVTQGGSGALTATISAAHTVDTQVVLTSSNSGVASVPSSVTVPAGQVSASIVVGALSPGNSDITASLNGTNAVSHVMVTPAPPTVVSLVPAVATVTLGASTTLTLTISSAQSSDTTVPLAVSPAGIVTAPAQVIVPAGQTSVGISVGTLAFGQAGITASLNNSSASAAVNVVPQPVAVVSIVPANLTMNVGATSQFTVAINATQPSNTEIALSVDQPSFLQVPPTVTVAQGQTSATFTATGLAVGNAVITASANNTSKSAAVHVSPQPAAIASLLPSPLPLQQGATGSLTVTINVAQEADLSIAIANPIPAVANVPASVTIPAGTVSAGIPVTALSPGNTDVTASVNGTSATSTVTVTPPPPVVTSIDPATLSLPKGTPSVLRVNVSRAPNIATAVALASTNPSIASVPPEVNIPAGASFAEFPVVANAEGQVTITATLNGGSAAASVTIAPAELVTLTLSPQTPTNYVGETVPFTATGTMTDGTTQDFTTRVTWTSSAAAVATIASTGVATPLAAGSTTIKASFTFTAVQTGQSVTINQETVLTVKLPVALALTAPTTTPIEGQDTTVTVASADPAPFGGLLVTLSGSGAGLGTFPPAVVIPEDATSATFTFSAVTAGSYTLSATAQNRLPGTLAFNIQPLLRISAVTPASGDVGATVTLAGTGFDPIAANNLISFRGINNTTVQSAALTATDTQITVRVPPLADSGPITLTNGRGTTQSPPFTVAREQNYDLVVSPAALTVFTGASGAAQAQLSSTGTKQYTGLVTLSVQGLPTGVTASFAPAATLSAFQAGAVTLTASAAAAPGSYPLIVRADAKEGGATFSRTAAITLNVQSATAVNGVKGRFVDLDGRGIAGVIVRADSTSVQTTSDAAGNFLLTGIPSGQVPLRVDATPANPLYPIYPTIVTVPAGAVGVLPDWYIAPPPADEDFTPINTATQTQIISDPRFPGFELTLPQGSSIIGHDGVAKTRVAIQRHDPDKFGVQLPPIPTRSIYQFNWGTPMGGIPTASLPVSLPNEQGLDPGAQAEIWYYDGLPNAPSGEWKLLGMGTVSPDGKKIVSNPGVGLTKFCGKCSAVCVAGGNNDKPDPPPDCKPCGKGGKPVTLATGQETPSETDLSIAGLLPITLSRSFRPFDAYNNIAGTAGSFGLGWASDYEPTLLVLSSALVRMILPGNLRINFTPDGSGGFTAPSDPRFYGAVLRTSGNNVYELQYKDGQRWKFEMFGVIHWLTEQRYPDGKLVSIARRSDGKMTSIQTNGARGVTLTYGANNHVSEVRDSAARTVKYTYTTQNRIETVTDPENGVTRYAYVDDTEMAAIPACPSVPGGVRLKSLLRPGKTQPIVQDYGPSRRVLRQRLEDGTELKFNYTVVGACVAHISNPSVQCTGTSCPSVDSWENFQAGWRISGGTIIAASMVDAQGNSQTQRYNQAGIASDTVDGQGQKTVYKRDANNRATAVIDALGRTTRFIYDSKGNVLRKTDPGGRVVEYTYDAIWNKLESETRYLEDGTPIVTRNIYDPTSGRILRRIDAENNTRTFTYTPLGQVKTSANGLNQSKAFEYNASGDLVRSLDPLGNETAFTLDSVGRVMGVVNPLGFNVQTRYDGIDQVLDVTDAMGGITRYEYDAQRRLKSVFDPLGRPVESYEYDLANRVTARTDAKLKSVRQTYDSAGRLKTVTDRNGRITTYEYDGQGRIERILFPDAAQTRTYDAAGRLTRIDEGSTSTEFQYDIVDRVVRETQEADGFVNRIEYQYDTLDRVVKRAVNGGDETTYAYDKASRLTGIGYRGKTTAYEWDRASRLVAKTLPNGVRQELQYDDAGRLTQITYKKSDGTSIEAIAYTYDAEGQRLTKSYSQASVTDTALAAEYDLANRMASLTLTASNVTYDLSYDDNGNLVRKENRSSAGDVTTYIWDSRDRLLEISAPGLTARFKYDGFGRRTERAVNGRVTRYVYDGAQAIAEIDNGQTVGLLTGLLIDELIARYSIAGGLAYLTDALNSVLAQSKDDQSIENAYSYSPFGETVVLGVDNGNFSQFTGRENDGTGMYYYRARYYDPVLKRFISEDPIGLEGGLNVYAYVGSNPVGNTDPLGLQAASMAGRAIGGAIGGAARGGMGGNVGGAIGGAAIGIILSVCPPTDRDKCERACDEMSKRAAGFCHAMAIMYGPKGSKAYARVYQSCMAQKDEEYIQCYQDCARDYPD